MRLNELRSQLRSLLTGVWAGALLNPNYVQRDSCITWADFESIMLPEDVSFEEIAALSQRRQYSFQLSLDGSLFQFYYLYEQNEETLRAARVAYYEASGNGFATEESEENLDLGNEPLDDPQNAELELVTSDDLPFRGPTPIISQEAVAQSKLAAWRRPRWLRIDFRAEASKCVLHNDCHIHFAGFPGSRLVVSGVPTPKQFVEFVFCCCYPELYEQARLDAHGQYVDPASLQSVNEIQVPVEPNPVFAQMTHLRVPWR